MLPSGSHVIFNIQTTWNTSGASVVPQAKGSRDLGGSELVSVLRAANISDKSDSDSSPPL
jgi:hypothetical protein